MAVFDTDRDFAQESLKKLALNNSTPNYIIANRIIRYMKSHCEHDGKEYKDDGFIGSYYESFKINRKIDDKDFKDLLGQ
jgi:hypothetical protein